MQVTVDIPDDLAASLIPPGQNPARALLEQSALLAYSVERMSRAQLRSLLGFETRYGLDGFLKQHRIDREAYSATDLEQDIHTINELRSA